MNAIVLKGIQALKFIIEVNFYISVMALILGSVLSVSGSTVIFEFNEDLYGALDNNLQMMMVYLALTETVVLAYSLISKNMQLMLPVGGFLVLMTGSVEFYGEINTIAIDPAMPMFFLYTGLSHILFGTLAFMQMSREN